LHFTFSFNLQDLHLQQILELQKMNLRSALSASEIEEQGFVTLQYTFEQLEKMHRVTPHLAVLSEDKVAGYALAMPRQYGHYFPELETMFETIDAEILNKMPEMEKDYLVMGQICIAKEFRGMGLFQQLYDVYLKRYMPLYGMVVTEISTMNKRSMRAHKKVGFVEVATHTDSEGITWVICKI
jgi:L-amino acid N-acyltransferase YncA